MPQDAFITQVKSKLRYYEEQLASINEEISKLTAQRDLYTQGHTAYEKILELEADPEMTSIQSQSTLPLEGLPSFANLSIPKAVETVLRESRRAMGVPDLLREIKKRGKSMEGPNSYNILYSSLKRNPNIFKKQGSLWALVNKNPETQAA
jgi:hypothetical protein